MEEAYEKFKGIITEEEFENLIKKKIKNVGGLLTREGAIAIIAAEYGVDIGIEQKRERIRINELQEGMNNVTLICRVKRIYPIKKFENGEVANILVDDESGEMRIALWNERTKILEKLSVGTVIEISHGYIKKGFRDAVELNVGRRGAVEISDISLDLPAIEQSMMKIGEIEEELRDISVAGRVKNIFDVREFETVDGRKGKVGSIILVDETGEARASFWNDRSDTLSNIKKNDILLLENAYTRDGFSGFEIHVGWQTYIRINPEKIDLPEIKEEIVKISYIKEGTINTRGTVKEIFGVKSFEKIDGGNGKVGSMMLEDETGEIRVVIWNEKTAVLENISRGMPLKISNARVKEGMDDLEIHVNTTTELSVEIPQENTIKNLRKGNVTIVGRVSQHHEEGFSMIDESGEVRVASDERPALGDLVKVDGVFEEHITAEEIKKSEGPFPTLEDLKTPKRGKIGDQGMVTIRGVVKSKVQGEEYARIVIDDGMEEMEGVVFGSPELGEEYLFTCRVDSTSFRSYNFQEIDILREAYRILERVGENG
jgi:replication factor A1